MRTGRDLFLATAVVVIVLLTWGMLSYPRGGTAPRCDFTCPICHNLTNRR